MMITKKRFFELYNRNSPLNKDRSVGEATNKLYRRNLAFEIAYILAGKGISANTVTVSYFLLAIVASLIFIYPSTLSLVLFILLYEVVYVLDCVDGQLARFHGTLSRFGDLLDVFSDLLTTALFPVVLGIRLFWMTGNNVFLMFACLGGLSFLYEGVWVQNSADILGSFSVENEETTTNRLRTILLMVDNLSVIALVILLLSLVSVNIFGLPLVGWFYICYVLGQFGLKVVLRYLIVLRKTIQAPKKKWKGWDKQNG